MSDPIHEHWQSILEVEVKAAWAGDADGSHDIGHLRRVWAMCCAIAVEGEEACDRQVLIAAAHLHDLVNLAKDDPDRHLASRRSAKAARVVLTRHGFPAGKLDAVSHAIEAHSFSAGIEPETVEARVLQDADRLDSLGAIGVARTFYVAGRFGSAIADADDPGAARRPLDDTRFVLDHFEVKLFRIAETMRTAGGRRLAERRVAVMRAFRDALLDELEVPETMTPRLEIVPETPSS